MRHNGRGGRPHDFGAGLSRSPARTSRRRSLAAWCRDARRYRALRLVRAAWRLWRVHLLARCRSHARTAQGLGARVMTARDLVVELERAGVWIFVSRFTHQLEI